MSAEDKKKNKTKKKKVLKAIVTVLFGYVPMILVSALVGYQLQPAPSHCLPIMTPIMAAAMLKATQTV
jgi:hypothetical protein